MKQIENGLNRQRYESPYMEVIEMEMQGVLCGSPKMRAKSGNTQSMEVEDVDWPE